MIQLQIKYYALLKEEAGKAEEAVTVEPMTAEALFLELRTRHRFSLEAKRLRVAVNDRYAPMQHVLQDGDRVVFIPPVAGG